MLLDTGRKPAICAKGCSIQLLQPDWKESCHNTPLSSPPVVQWDEALRNNRSLSPLGLAPPPSWLGNTWWSLQPPRRCTDTLTTHLSSPVKSARQQQPQQ
ncbi:hypothetical protein OYC64_019196 [Pagothenia borchgrevinki]|uniref:Uncharacterized protein n=1 Tax=Pagothenia borchgrevinki TaxID=8213 RepID=A0ABD2GS84_PAGBO